LFYQSPVLSFLQDGSSAQSTLCRFLGGGAVLGPPNRPTLCCSGSNANQAAISLFFDGVVGRLQRDPSLYQSPVSSFLHDGSLAQTVPFFFAAGNRFRFFLPFNTTLLKKYPQEEKKKKKRLKTK